MAGYEGGSGGFPVLKEKMNTNESIYPLEKIFNIIEDALQEPGENWKIKEEISFHADRILFLCDELSRLGDRSMDGIVEISEREKEL